ncbi:hypothetical protein [Neptuniibacter sp. QD37_11]|uniref:hypothetical protein n=1 Tax=Neptuniibacter sp. QD37_11 TaxID=3398209 RepID=UPI0039F47C83
MVQSLYPVTLLGSEGAMASTLMSWLDERRVKQLDLIKFPNIRTFHRAVSSNIAHQKRRQNKIDNTLILSVPFAVYESASNLRGHRAISRSVMGHHGKGQGNTLCMHISSLHELPSNVLEGFSGMVIGAHQMYGPLVEDVSEQTVVLTVPESKKDHHLHDFAVKEAKAFFENAGHQYVTVIAPKTHDKLMSLQQFMAHSFFLLLGMVTLDCPKAEGQWLEHAKATAKRVLSGKAHVYEGIAKGNPYNQGVVECLNDLKRSLPESIGLQQFIHQLSETLRDYYDKALEGLDVTSKQATFISTPISRKRDELWSELPQSSDLASIEVEGESTLQRYLDAVKGNYTAWYDDMSLKLIA